MENNSNNNKEYHKRPIYGSFEISTILWDFILKTKQNKKTCTKPPEVLSAESYVTYVNAKTFRVILTLCPHLNEADLFGHSDT